VWFLIPELAPNLKLKAPTIVLPSKAYSLYGRRVVVCADEEKVAEVRPWAERFALIIWPILMGVSIWFFASYLPTLRGGLK
jgi:hypothetical protein